MYDQFKNFSCEEMKEFNKTLEKAKHTNTPFADEQKIIAASEIEKFEKLGKSRRWIKRFIKRKYNINY